jgi:hypothetical protein
MPRPFEALTPMLVERFALRLQIESRRQAGLDRRRLQRLQDQPRDLGIHRRGLQRLAGRRVKGRARADALVTRRMAGVVVRGRHAQAAPAAHDHPGEQRDAGACGTPFARPIGADLFLIALELLPGDVGRQAIGQEDLGILRARRASSAARVTGLMTAPVDRPDPINVDAGIDRIAEQIPERRPTRSAPFQFALARSPGQTHRHLDVILYEIAQNPADRPNALEKREHHANHALRLLVGVERHFARGTAQVAHRQRLAEFPPPGLGVAARQHPSLENVELRFRHRSLQTEQQAIIVVRRIIYAIDIGDQRVEQRAYLQQLMPVPARSRQPGHLDAQNQTDMAQAHFRHQPLEAEPSFDGAAGSAEIVVDGDDGLSRPTEMERPIDQRILEFGRFRVALNLLRRRLPDVDDRQSLLMLSRDLLGREAGPTRQEIPVHD